MCITNSMIESTILKNIYVCLINILTNVTIVKSTTMYLHFLHYALKATLPFEQTSIFTCTIAFWTLRTWIIPKYFLFFYGTLN